MSSHIAYDLSGAVAVITGGGRGIGKAIARALAAAGASMVVAGRRGPELEAVAREIRESGGKALAIVTDLISSERIERLVEGTIGEFGRIDILVNNAATSCLTPLLEFKEKHWARTVNSNCSGPLVISSNASDFITGQSIYVDGGYLAT
ncbi:MAG: SDR family NAD(P)-dependent oxidoreductase [Anaerolineae bacterium]